MEDGMANQARINFPPFAKWDHELPFLLLKPSTAKAKRKGEAKGRGI
jgi:hypothetical protein